jgi:hypothetical protein
MVFALWRLLLRILCYGQSPVYLHIRKASDETEISFFAVPSVWGAPDCFQPLSSGKTGPSNVHTFSECVDRILFPYCSRIILFKQSYKFPQCVQL